MKTTEERNAQVVTDELFEDNEDLFRDSASEAASLARKRKSILLWILHRLKCDYPCYLYCFCINPLGCMKSIQAVVLNWFAIIAATTLVSLYWSTSLLVLFSSNVGYFMFLGLGCLWTAAMLLHHTGKIAKLGKNLDETVTKMMHTEIEVTSTLALLDLANDRWVDCLDELHAKNKEIRVVGRKLDKRKQQAETQSEQLEELLIKFGGRVTADVLRKRHAIDNLIIEQDTTLEELQGHVGDMQAEQIEFNEHAVQFQEDLEYLNETIGSIKKPMNDLEAIKPNLHRMGADVREFEAFLSGHIQYLTVLERITILREMTYTQSIFFNALRQNDGQINEQLFNELIIRLPKSLRDAFWETGGRYKDYRCVLSKKKLGRKKYGGMDEALVIQFLKDMEAQAFQVERRYSSKMPNPSRIGYDYTDDEEPDEEMQQHISPFEETDEEEEEDEKLVVTREITQ